MNRNCPYCGAPLPEEAAFCPNCAQSVNERTQLKPPRPILGKFLRIGIPLLVLCAAALSIFLYTRPRTYDSGDTGQVIYSDRDGSYQLLLNQAQDRHKLMPGKEQAAEPDGEYRTSIQLYINRAEDGSDATEEFMTKVEDVTAEVVQIADDCPPPPVDMSLSVPAFSDYQPDAALVSFLDFVGSDGSWELLWTITMKNGDTILLRQLETVYLITIYHYSPEDAPMGTIEELQALVDRIGADASIGPKDQVYLHLPPVTYDGGLIMDKRSINLVGSADEAGNRTTFTDTVRVAAREDWMTYINDIDLVGGGRELGVSGSARLHLTGCTISGWQTGVLAYSQGCVNLDECRVENNTVGFHFNSPSGLISDNIFENDQFLNNGTAVLLEQVPTKKALSFPGSRFEGNGADIDNRCQQKIDTSETVFD